MNIKEKENVLYLNGYYRGWTNLYSSINKSQRYNFISKEDLKKISLESYDAFIIDLFIFDNKDVSVSDLINKICSLKKPVILIYSSEMKENYQGIEYLKEKFNIEFETKDASIIENSFEEYLPERYNGTALSMISKNGYGRAYVKNTNYCFVLRFDNIAVIHDCEVAISNRNNYSVIQKPTLVKELLNTFYTQNEPEWVKSVKVLDELKIEESLAQVESEIQNLEDEKKKYLEELTSNREYKKMLYASGDELVNIVERVLIEMLKISVQDLDIKKEDLSFELDGKKILVEVKGVNTSIKREHVSQIQRHVLDEAQKNGVDDDDISKMYKGLLIINPYIKSPIQERKCKEFYSKAVIGDIEHYDICAIDTITLLGMYEKYKKDKKIQLKDIILNNNCIEPDFYIIEK